MYQKFPNPGWKTINVTTVHRAVPVGTELAAIPVGGVAIWTPSFPCLVRAFTVNDDSADPLVGGGGATALSIGILSATATFVLSTATANYTTMAVGGGALGPNIAPSSGTGGIGVQDSGVVVYPAGSVPGRAAISRPINAYSNAGTYTGTLRFRFEMRPFAGGWA